MNIDVFYFVVGKECGIILKNYELLEVVMALINCFECDKKVSDTAKVCPYCGFDIKRMMIKNKRKEIEETLILLLHKFDKIFYFCGIICTLCTILCVIVLVFSYVIVPCILRVYTYNNFLNYYKNQYEESLSLIEELYSDNKYTKEEYDDLINFYETKKNKLEKLSQEKFYKPIISMFEFEEYRFFSDLELYLNDREYSNSTIIFKGEPECELQLAYYCRYNTECIEKNDGKCYPD